MAAAAAAAAAADLAVDAAPEAPPAEAEMRLLPNFTVAASKMDQRARLYQEMASDVDVAVDAVRALAVQMQEAGGLGEADLKRLLDTVRRLSRTRSKAEEREAAASLVARELDSSGADGADTDWAARLAEARRSVRNPDVEGDKADKRARDVRRAVRDVADPHAALSDEEDEDLVMEAQELASICPITRELLVEPVTSSVCHHTYSKAAILQHLRTGRRGSAPCPVAGCRSDVTQAALKADRRVAAHVERVARHASATQGRPDALELDEEEEEEEDE